MTGKEYQEKAMRTANPECKDVCNFALGLTGESGEVADLIKKAKFQGHGLNREGVIKELGDVLWYVALGCEIIGTNIDEVMNLNIDKLNKRYPCGFNFNDSIKRKDLEAKQ